MFAPPRGEGGKKRPYLFFSPGGRENPGSRHTMPNQPPALSSGRGNPLQAGWGGGTSQGFEGRQRKLLI